jgi:K+-transporting ATPase KdpF subunit
VTGMGVVDYVLLAVAALLVVYLLVALLDPERF